MSTVKQRVWDHELFTKLAYGRLFVDGIHGSLMGGDCRDAETLMEVLTADFSYYLELSQGARRAKVWDERLKIIADDCGLECVNEDLGIWKMDKGIDTPHITEMHSFHRRVRGLLQWALVEVHEFLFQHCDIGSPEFEMVKSIDCGEYLKEGGEQKIKQDCFDESLGHCEYEDIEFVVEN